MRDLVGGAPGPGLARLARRQLAAVARLGWFLLTAGIWFASGPGSAQAQAQAQIPAPSPAGDEVEAVEPARDGAGRLEGHRLTAAAVNAELGSLDADASLADPVKSIVRERYTRALELLDAEERDLALAESFRRAVTDAPAEAAAMRDELAALPDEPDVQVDAAASDVQAIGRELDGARADLARLTTEWKAARESFQRIRARAVTAPAELTAAREAANVAGAAATREADATSPDGKASAMLAEATAQAARARLEALEAESAAADVRGTRADATADLLEKKVALADTRVRRLEELRRSASDRVVGTVSTEVETLLDSLEREPPAGEEPAVKAVVDDIEKYSQSLREIGQRDAELSANRQRIASAVAEVESIALPAKAQAEAGGITGEMAEVLLESRQRLPAIGPYKQVFRGLQSEIAKVRSDAFKAGQKLSTLADPAEETAALAAALAGGRESGPTDQEVEVARRLVEGRRSLLESFEAESVRLVRNLADNAESERAFVERIEEFSRVLDRELFWVRVAPGLDAEALRDVPSAVAWLAGGSRFSDLGRALGKAAATLPLLVVPLLAALAALWGFRGRIKRSLLDTAKPTKRISTDKFGYTVAAFGLTVLLAVPVPLLTSGLGLAMGQLPGEPEWIGALAKALRTISPPLFGTLMVMEVARPGGLGEAHFRWAAAPLKKLRSVLRWFIPLHFFATLVLHMLWWGNEGARFHGTLGRFAVISSMAFLAFGVWQLLTPRGGIFGGAIEHARNPIYAQLRPVWVGALVALPVSLGLLGALGYHYAALSLRNLLSQTLVAVIAVVLGYAMLHRWFLMHQRKLALEQALAARRARREEAEAPADEFDLPELKPFAMDLNEVKAQTEALLRFVLTVALAWALWVIWRDLVPVFRDLEAFPLFGTMSVAEFVGGTVVLLATYVAMRNLPGLMEVGFLKRLALQPGVRFAAISLTQYVVVAAGVAIAIGLYGFDLSKLGWVLAALSVGLGFGLQEVVANFVCGLILLFERPIRVGDIVTVGDVSGVVSRIQIRATTVVSWTRQEYIIPNKEFITGNILNWTLDNTINRIEIRVGVAYGTDVEKVTAVLDGLARENEDVLEEPAPFVTFEAFGESTLDFALRCYLAAPERRLPVLHDMNTAIAKKFAEEGIEIAFPQRDLHLRSVEAPVAVTGAGSGSPVISGARGQ